MPASACLALPHDGGLICNVGVGTIPVREHIAEVCGNVHCCYLLFLLAAARHVREVWLAIPGKLQAMMLYTYVVAGVALQKHASSGHDV